MTTRIVRHCAGATPLASHGKENEGNMITRRESIGVMASCLLPAQSRIERMRTNPRAGDIFAGPNGATVTVTRVWDQMILGSMVFYTTRKPDGAAQERCTPLATWEIMGGWDVATAGDGFAHASSSIAISVASPCCRFDHSICCASATSCFFRLGTSKSTGEGHIAK